MPTKDLADYRRFTKPAELHPANPAYPPRTYSPAEIESIPVQIIGVVVELRRKIKYSAQHDCRHFCIKGGSINVFSIQ